MQSFLHSYKVYEIWREDGYADGRADGVVETLQTLVSDGLLPLSEAAKRAGMTEVEFSALLEK